MWLYKTSQHELFIYKKGKIQLATLRFGLMWARYKIFQNWPTWSLITMRKWRKISNGLGTKLGLRTKFVNLEISWTWLALE